ncbi:MAG: hypothetical protein NTY20_00460 [Candidatus Aenigmarchaeota archaeon]|nr:hypothetical protein [Candidatus Aenigmarchaeota archaeon]
MSETFVYKSGIWKAAYPVLALMTEVFDLIVPSSNPDAEIYNTFRGAREIMDERLQQKGIRKIAITSHSAP